MSKKPDFSSLRNPFKKTKEEPPENEGIEKEAKREIGVALQKIKENEKAYREKLAFETDSRFYFSVVFRDGKEMDEFLQSKGIKLEHDSFVFYEDVKDKLKK